MMKLFWYNFIVCFWVIVVVVVEIVIEDWRFKNNTGCFFVFLLGNWLYFLFGYNLFFFLVLFYLEVFDIFFVFFLEVRFVLLLRNVLFFIFVEFNMLSWIGDFIGWINFVVLMSGFLVFVNKIVLSFCRSFLFFFVVFKFFLRFLVVDVGWL